MRSEAGRAESREKDKCCGEWVKDENEGDTLLNRQNNLWRIKQVLGEFRGNVEA